MANKKSPIIEEFTRLIIRRESLRKEAGISEEEYTRKFGKLIYEIYKEKMNCVFLKKKIGQCVLKKNKGEVVIREEIEAYFDSEMAEYQQELAAILQHYEDCQTVATSSAADELRAKAEFRKIAKLIHPDMLGGLANDEEIKELWDKAKTAYHANNADELMTIEILVNELLKNKGIDVDEIEIPNPEIKVKLLKQEIEQIINSAPYTYKEFLYDETLYEEKEATLKDELETYLSYKKDLEKTLSDYYGGGGDIWDNSLLN